METFAIYRWWHIACIKSKSSFLHQRHRGVRTCSNVYPSNTPSVYHRSYCRYVFMSISFRCSTVNQYFIKNHQQILYIYRTYFTYCKTVILLQQFLTEDFFPAHLQLGSVCHLDRYGKLAGHWHTSVRKAPYFCCETKFIIIVTNSHPVCLLLYCSVQSGGQRHVMVYYLERLGQRDHTWEGKLSS